MTLYAQFEHMLKELGRMYTHTHIQRKFNGVLMEVLVGKIKNV
jgi:hypothetical protein